MGDEGFDRVGYRTRACPRCGAELYADMHVCYGCLYDFSRDSAGPDTGADAGCGGDTVDLSVTVAPKDGRVALGMWLRTASVDVWVPVPEQGISLGRDPTNDVVLHSPAVSRRHLRMVPTPDGMEVEDLGSKNRATYRGREISDRVVVTYGDAIDVCGCILVMTGPEPTEKRL